MEVGFRQASGYLEVALSGSYSLRGMLLAIDLIGARAGEVAAKRVLVDVSDLVGVAPLSERYVYASRAALVLRDLWKCAAFAGPVQPVVPFTSLVAKGKGLALEVFRERADALSWLLSR